MCEEGNFKYILIKKALFEPVSLQVWPISLSLKEKLAKYEE